MSLPIFRKGDLVFWWPPEAQHAGVELYVPCIATKTSEGRVVEAAKANGEVVVERGRVVPEVLYARVMPKSELTISPRKLLLKLAPAYPSLAAVREAVTPYRKDVRA